MSDTANGCRTVVTGTDGSESSPRAAPRAASPADAPRRSECDVLVVHPTG